jgi:hypothetical protein
MDVRTVTRNGFEISREEIDHDRKRLKRYERGAKELELVESRSLTAEELEDISTVETAKSGVQRLNDDLRRNSEFLALEKPTATQTAAQVQALTRQVSALLKMQGRGYEG